MPRAMSNGFPARLADAAEAVDRLLGVLLAPGATAGEEIWPARLGDAIRYAALGGGKRLRPFVLIEAARLFGEGGGGILRAAAALECIHAYSLVHDDLPAMDDDDLRRGRPTVHRAFDEATAILAGDALLTLAFDILADPLTHPDAEVRIALVGCLAKAAGAGGMAGGQALDMAGEGASHSADEIERLQAMKTGALFRFAAEAGAILAHASDGDRRRLAAFGAALGAAFQLADDLLDQAGATAILGKAKAGDAVRGKPTLVALLGPDAARALLRERVNLAAAALAPFGDRASALIGAARFVEERADAA